MRNSIFLRSTALFPAFEKPNEGKPSGKTDTPPAAPATTTVTIAGIDVALPMKFNAGHVLSDTEAKVIDAAYRRQFANNQNAAFKAYEAKLDEWNKSTAADKGDAPKNPCTESAMTAAYTAYVPNVGAASQTSLEKARNEAGLRALVEMMDEHNALIESGKPGTMGPAKVALAKGKGAAEARDALVAKVLASSKQADRVQRHLDAILAERGATKTEPSAVTLDATTFDF